MSYLEGFIVISVSNSSMWLAVYCLYRYTAWEASVGYPPYDYTQAEAPETQSHVQDLARMGRIDSRSTFLQAKVWHIS